MAFDSVKEETIENMGRKVLEHHLYSLTAMLKLIYKDTEEVKNCEVGVMLNEMSEEERQNFV